MESQLTEALTFPATSYSANFFHPLPSDDRFLQNTFQKFMPNGSIDEPTMNMLFSINDSPFFGKEGKFVTGDLGGKASTTEYT